MRQYNNNYTIQFPLDNLTIMCYNISNDRNNQR